VKLEEPLKEGKCEKRHAKRCGTQYTKEMSKKSRRVAMQKYHVPVRRIG